MTESKHIKKYLRHTSRKLYCSKPTKAALMQGLYDELGEYAPHSYEELCQTFGSPSDVASQMMDSVDENEAKRQKRNKRFAIAGVLAALVIVIGVLGTFAADAWSKFYREGTWTVVYNEPVVTDRQELSDEELQKMWEEGKLE